MAVTMGEVATGRKHAYLFVYEYNNIKQGKCVVRSASVIQYGLSVASDGGHWGRCKGGDDGFAMT